jgi:hypothetical protein
MIFPPTQKEFGMGLSQKEFCGCVNEPTTQSMWKWTPGDESPGYEAAPNELGFVDGPCARFQAGWLRHCCAEVVESLFLWWLGLCKKYLFGQPQSV